MNISRACVNSNFGKGLRLVLEKGNDERKRHVQYRLIDILPQKRCFWNQQPLTTTYEKLNVLVKLQKSKKFRITQTCFNILHCYQLLVAKFRFTEDTVSEKEIGRKFVENDKFVIDSKNVTFLIRYHRKSSPRPRGTLLVVPPTNGNFFLTPYSRA